MPYISQCAELRRFCASWIEDSGPHEVWNESPGGIRAFNELVEKVDLYRPREARKTMGPAGLHIENYPEEGQRILDKYCG